MNKQQQARFRSAAERLNFLPQPEYRYIKTKGQDLLNKKTAFQLQIQPNDRLLIYRPKYKLDRSTIPISRSFIETHHKKLGFPEAHFAAITLDGVLGSNADAPAVLQTLWRLLKPEGRILIHDQFLPEPGQFWARHTLMGRVLVSFYNPPLWCISEILRGPRLICIERNEPSWLHPMYRWVTLARLTHDQDGTKLKVTPKESTC